MTGASLVAAVALTSSPATACQCADGGRFLLHPVSLDAAHRNTRVVILAFDSGVFAADPIITIDGVASDGFELQREDTFSQQLTTVTFDELLPPLAEVVFMEDGETEALRFITSDVVDEIPPTWTGGVDYVDRLPNGDEQNCIFGPHIGYHFRGFNDDWTPPNDLLVEMESQYGEKVWGAYGAVGMGLGDCTSIVPSLEDDWRQPFAVTFYDEAGNASETHQVSGCACSAPAGGFASFIGVITACLLAFARRRAGEVAGPRRGGLLRVLRDTSEG